MIEFDAFTLFVIVVAVMLTAFLLRSSKRGKRSAPGEELSCSACGATHPRFARYCKRCGRPL